MQSEETGETVPSLSALPTAPVLTSKGEGGPSQSLGAFSAGYCPEDSKEGGEEDPSDPASADLDKEPNLFPPNPQDNWVPLKQQALREGDLDIAARIVTPVIYLEEIGSSGGHSLTMALDLRSLGAFWTLSLLLTQ